MTDQHKSKTPMAVGACAKKLINSAADIIAAYERFMTVERTIALLVFDLAMVAVLMAGVDIFSADWMADVVMFGSTAFVGTDNPRELRVIQALLTRPRRREDIDAIAGAANGPDLISNIRDLFPKSDSRDAYIACERVPFIDRDGRKCMPGVYSFTTAARRFVIQWLAKRSSKVVIHA